MAESALEKFEGVQQFFDVFNSEDIEALRNWIELNESKKKTWHFTDTSNLPTSLRNTFQRVKQIVTFVPNTAILKLYDTSYQSGAYEMHVDPPEYQEALVLCSLTGNAVLEFIDSEEVAQQVECIPNSVIILRPNIAHRVSQPSNADGERLFLFFGKSSAFEG